MIYTVEAHSVTKAFGDHLALDRVDLSIEGGSVLALLGPNGAGSTSADDSRLLERTFPKAW